MADCDLNEEVEGLQLEEEIVLASCSSRRLRKRPIVVGPLDEGAVKRKRFVENKKDLSEKELTKLYLNENFRVPKQNPLETVYEEETSAEEAEQPPPIEPEEQAVKTDKKKVKRVINFPLITTKAKKQQRKKMVKRLEVASPTFLNNKKLKSKVSKAKFEEILKKVELEDEDMKVDDSVSEK
jgi:hypothetical protein